MFEALATAIDELEIPTDGPALTAVVGLRDRLDARIGCAVAAYETSGGWEAEGATSMTAWLADRGRMSRARARRESSQATKLAQLPVTAAAARDGVLSAGQVEAITANLDRDTVALFADHEAAVVPSLAELSAGEVATAMRTWREHATADRPPAPEPSQALHLSRSLSNRWRLDGTLDAETGELVETALRLAETGDTDGEPVRLAGRRRADALADVCRYFLDHQHTRTGAVTGPT